MLCFQLILFDKILLHFFVKTTGISSADSAGELPELLSFSNLLLIRLETESFTLVLSGGYSWQNFIIIKTLDQTLGISIEESLIYDATIFCCQLGGKRSCKDELIVNVCGELV